VGLAEAEVCLRLCPMSMDMDRLLQAPLILPILRFQVPRSLHLQITLKHTPTRIRIPGPIHRIMIPVLIRPQDPSRQTERLGISRLHRRKPGPCHVYPYSNFAICSQSHLSKFGFTLASLHFFLFSFSPLSHHSICFLMTRPVVYCVILFHHIILQVDILAASNRALMLSFYPVGANCCCCSCVYLIVVAVLCIRCI